jgi:hypothetical protein
MVSTIDRPQGEKRVESPATTEAAIPVTRTVSTGSSSRGR